MCAETAEDSSHCSMPLGLTCVRALSARLRRGIRRRGCVAGGLVALRIEGTAVREVLAKGCGLDLQPHIFSEGFCARTRFAKPPTALDCRGLSCF